ncbi:MAG: hypothetical protein WBO69_14920, partial [Thermoanaerobaculia bacterium]
NEGQAQKQSHGGELVDSVHFYLLVSAAVRSSSWLEMEVSAGLQRVREKLMCLRRQRRTLPLGLPSQALELLIREKGHQPVGPRLLTRQR